MNFDFSKATEWAYKDMLTFFPENVSTFGGELDSLFAMIYYWSAAIFILTYAILIAFIIMYRHKEGNRAYYYHGNNLMEFTWTLLPTFLFAGIGLWSDSAWSQSKYASRVPNPDVEIDVLGYQSGFGWMFRYPGPDGKFGIKARNQISTANPFGIDSNDLHGKDDLVITSPGGARPVAAHFPVNKNVLVNLSSNDVLHSFFLPNFRKVYAMRLIYLEAFRRMYLLHLRYRELLMLCFSLTCKWLVVFVFYFTQLCIILSDDISLLALSLDFLLYFPTLEQNYFL